MRKTLLCTGSGGLIGREIVEFFTDRDWLVVGIDNNLRAYFFGSDGDVSKATEQQKKLNNFIHYNIDIRDKIKLEEIFKNHKFDAVCHMAAQASHDWGSQHPVEDFEINAAATVYLLENTRLYCKDAVFVLASTNKIWGDNPNRIKLKELETRYDFDDPEYENGITEWFNVDNCLHSLYGCSKLTADIYTQEYAKYYGMKTYCLRAGCLTGPKHMGAELHGFLDYLIKCNVIGREYKIFGYKGKQVRDNIHSWDVVNFINTIIENPKPSTVYNLGGGKANSISILEAITKIEGISGKKMIVKYIPDARKGDHICYFSDLSKIKQDYPDYRITKSLDDIFNEIYNKYNGQ